MKILNIGLDEKAVIPNSRVFGRITEYQRAVEKYELISVQKNLFKPLVLLKVFWEARRALKKENFEMQFRAFVNFSRNNKKAELWIVGEGPEKNKLVTLAKDLGIAGQVRFFGWSDNISEFYAQADAFLLTSLAEGWPLVIAEAAAVSLPIIMTDVGSAGEFIKNGENGIVVPVNDASALREAMEKIIEDADLRNKLGEAARQSFLNLPSKEEILALYKKSWQLAIDNNRK